MNKSNNRLRIRTNLFKFKKKIETCLNTLKHGLKVMSFCLFQCNLNQTIYKLKINHSLDIYMIHNLSLFY